MTHIGTMTFTKRISATLLLLAVLLLPGCGGEDDLRKNQLIEHGYSEEQAAELSKLKLTDEEIASLGEARKGGVDQAAAVGMVKSMHDRNQKFDLGAELPFLVGQGMAPTALSELVEIEAVPRWTDDIRAMKNAGLSDVTIVEIAKIRFGEKKETLSGGEYARLKEVGMSDSGILAFVRGGGTYEQLQTISLAMRLGKSEQEALKEAGM